MALRLQMMNESGQWEYVSTDGTSPMRTTHIVGLNDGRETQIRHLRLENDDTANYYYINIRVSCFDSNSSGGADSSWITFGPSEAGGFFSTYTLPDMSLGTMYSSEFYAKVTVPGTTPAGTYTDLKIQVSYDEVQVNP